MKIIYKFDDGSTSEVEVDEELGAFISAEERKEENRQRSYKRKFIAYESFVYEGHEFGYEEDFLDLIVYENELDKVIKKSINNLPSQYKIPIALREIQGLSYDEISNITNSTIGTVKSRIARARAKIKSDILKYSRA